VVPSVDPDGVLDNSTTVTLTQANPIRTDMDMGYAGQGSITGTLFLDVNRNDVVNPGEGLGGITVSLTADFDGDGVPDVVTTVTAADGTYSFNNLPVGDFLQGIVYTITVDPAGIPANTLASLDPDGVLDLTTQVLLTTANPEVEDLDFGWVIAAPDLSLVKTDNDVTARPGDVIAYTLTYGNTGTVPATGVVITETLPPHATFEPTLSSPGWTHQGGGVYTLAIGTLLVNQTGSALFAFTVDDTVPAGLTELNNTASIADDGTNGPDLNPDDNTSSDTTPVDAAPDLSISENRWRTFPSRPMAWRSTQSPTPT
jgi:uncharacterized repeat protein (TIGR01451 family)